MTVSPQTHTLMMTTPILSEHCAHTYAAGYQGRVGRDPLRPRGQGSPRTMTDNDEGPNTHSSARIIEGLDNPDTIALQDRLLANLGDTLVRKLEAIEWGLLRTTKVCTHAWMQAIQCETKDISVCWIGPTSRGWWPTRQSRRYLSLTSESCVSCVCVCLAHYNVSGRATFRATTTHRAGARNSRGYIWGRTCRQSLCCGHQNRFKQCGFRTAQSGRQSTSIIKSGSGLQLF